MNVFVWKLSKIGAQKKVFLLTFFTFDVPFNGLFSPTSRSWMSNIFRDSESLGKSNWKKWSNIWTFLFGSGLKSRAKKKKKFCWFCLCPPSYGIGATIPIGREMLCLPYAGFLFFILYGDVVQKQQLEVVVELYFHPSSAVSQVNVFPPAPQPSECGRRRTLHSLHGHTAAWLQFNGNLAVWMSQISTEWRESSIMTLSTIHWVPVQDKGSKLLCLKLGALKITPNDCLHQEYLTINLGSTSDCQKLKLPLGRLFWRWRGRCWPAGAARDRECRRRRSVLPFNLSDTDVTSQDGSCLEFIAAIEGRQCLNAIFRMRVEEGCGTSTEPSHWPPSTEP